jgi:hypothetical protein
MPRVSSLKEIEVFYYCFPDYKEKIRKFGLIAVRFKYFFYQTGSTKIYSLKLLRPEIISRIFDIIK